MFKKFSWLLFSFSISRYVKIRCATNNFTYIAKGCKKLFNEQYDRWPSIERMQRNYFMEKMTSSHQLNSRFRQLH